MVLLRLPILVGKRRVVVEKLGVGGENPFLRERSAKKKKKWFSHPLFLTPVAPNSSSRWLVPSGVVVELVAIATMYMY